MVRPEQGDTDVSKDKGCGLWAALAIVVIAVLMGGPALASWKPEVKPQLTPQQALERLDKDLLPVIGRLTATFEDIRYEDDEAAAEAYITIIQRTASKGYGVVAASPYQQCYDDYRSVLLSGFLLLGDSVDSYRVKDSSGNPSADFRPQLDAALYLLLDYGTLVRGTVTCDGGAAAPTATPRQAPATPGPVQSG